MINFDDVDFDERSLSYSEDIEVTASLTERGEYCIRSNDPDVRAAIEALDARKREINVRM
jgi:hypothetical protein